MPNPNPLKSCQVCDGFAGRVKNCLFFSLEQYFTVIVSSLLVDVENFVLTFHVNYFD